MGTWYHRWVKYGFLPHIVRVTPKPQQCLPQLTGHFVMSSGHSWGSSEEGSSHTLHEPSVWSDPALCPWHWHPSTQFTRGAATPSPPSAQGDMDRGRKVRTGPAGLTWGPGDRQNRTASCGQRGLGRWDGKATSPTLPGWTVGRRSAPGQSPPLTPHRLQKAGIKSKTTELLLNPQPEIYKFILWQNMEPSYTRGFNATPFSY